MIQLNLLPDVKKEFIRAQKQRNFVISISIVTVVASGVILVLLGSWVYGGQALIINDQTNKIDQKASQLQNVEDLDKYLTVQNQLSQLDELHQGKTVYSRLFGYLEALNPAAPNNVAFSTVTIRQAEETGENSIELEGTTRNFSSLASFKTTLEAATLTFIDASDQSQEVNLFESVAVEEAGIAQVDGTQLVSFTVRVNYVEDAFLNTITDPRVNVPSEVTSDGDRNAPRPVFGEQPEDQ